MIKKIQQFQEFDIIFYWKTLFCNPRQSTKCPITHQLKSVTTFLSLFFIYFVSNIQFSFTNFFHHIFALLFIPIFFLLFISRFPLGHNFSFQFFFRFLTSPWNSFLFKDTQWISIITIEHQIWFPFTDTEFIRIPDQFIEN